MAGLCRRAGDARACRQAEALNAKLEYQANHDPLTGLPNRALLDDRLGQAILAARRSSTSLALFVVDLNRFKLVNDRFGHRSGDLVLAQLGRRLQAALREVDTVARVGGDEFAILLSTVKQISDAELIAEKVLRTLAEPIAVEGKTVTVGASIGIALYPKHGQDAQALLDAADAAMYAAKRGGDGYRVAGAPISLEYRASVSQAGCRL